MTTHVANNRLLTSYQSSLPLVNQKFKPLVYAAGISTGLAVAALFAPYQAIKIIGMTVFTGVGYGIANDMSLAETALNTSLLDISMMEKT
jgi:hypothetical protein